jgi:hypothetical protein
MDRVYKLKVSKVKEGLEKVGFLLRLLSMKLTTETKI